jgi:hypothetical protein
MDTLTFLINDKKTQLSLRLPLSQLEALRNSDMEIVTRASEMTFCLSVGLSPRTL